MKRTQLLNRHISRLVAELGHMDEIIVADAGLPVPSGVEVIDLAVCPGLPSFFDVLSALKSELAIEAAIFAKEASQELAGTLTATLTAWGDEIGKNVDITRISHDDFKKRSATAKAVIRTGETTPYANVILISGVVF
ncbi:D-ribose pyranase [Thalassospira lucentensis]|uniref:D-ribose pyranase n=1 Tax=Thalassospira lucentensis TaxID=168935 RepID=UPI00142E2DB4|nr:D-ribose pyranase [Thalassospira lucentensis]NIZ02444.1 D-ribose pyranase [Thalassospira lucentensis]